MEENPVETHITEKGTRPHFTGLENCSRATISIFFSRVPWFIISASFCLSVSLFSLLTNFFCRALVSAYLTYPVLLCSRCDLNSKWHFTFSFCVSLLEKRKEKGLKKKANSKILLAHAKLSHSFPSGPCIYLLSHQRKPEGHINRLPKPTHGV